MCMILLNDDITLDMHATSFVKHPPSQKSHNPSLTYLNPSLVLYYRLYYRANSDLTATSRTSESEQGIH